MVGCAKSSSHPKAQSLFKVDKSVILGHAGGHLHKARAAPPPLHARMIATSHPKDHSGRRQLIESKRMSQSLAIRTCLHRVVNVVALAIAFLVWVLLLRCCLARNEVSSI